MNIKKFFLKKPAFFTHAQFDVTVRGSRTGCTAPYFPRTKKLQVGDITILVAFN